MDWLKKHFVQINIFIFSSISIYYLSSNLEGAQKLGFIFGVISQPFWIYETYRSKQHGMFLLSLWYSFFWVRGLLNFI